LIKFQIFKYYDLICKLHFIEGCNFIIQEKDVMKFASMSIEMISSANSEIGVVFLT